MLKNIIIVNDSAYVIGGAAKVALTSAIGLSNLGYNVVLFAAYGPVSDEVLASNVKVVLTDQYDILHDPHRLRAIFQGVWNVKAKKMFGNLLEQYDEQDTVIHFHVWIKSLSSSIFSAVVKTNFKVFFTLHDFFLYCPTGGLYDYQKQQICDISPMGLRCVCCNCDSRSMLQKQWRVIRQFVQNREVKKILKQATFISISDLSEKVFSDYIGQRATVFRVNNPIDDAVPVYLKENRKSYLFVARLSPEKGLDLFCKTITDLHLKGIVLGNGDLYETYKNDYPNISFAGWVDGKKKLEYISQAKCLIFASKWYETYGLSVAEFLSYGIPCVVPDRCAASELIEDGKNGFIFKTGNLQSLKDTVLKVELGKLRYNSAEIAEDFKKRNTDNCLHVQKLINLYQRSLQSVGLR